MWKAILYKEWIKSRWFLLAALVVMSGFAGYGMLRLHRGISLMGAGHIWEVMLTRHAVFIDQMQFVPLLAGLLLAVVQFVPEMQRKCLKLTLHLPVAALRTLGAMLSFGVAALVVCYGLNVLILLAGTTPVLPAELRANILGQAAPWYLSGLAAYLLTVWVILEPTWKRRLVDAVMAVLLLRIFFLASVPQAYNGFLPLLTLYVLLAASLSWLSVVRFMAGKQD